MCKTKEVDHPDHHHPTYEGVLADEEDGSKDDCEDDTEDWHHHSELEIVHQHSPD